MDASNRIHLNFLGGSPLHLYESESATRSPSPAPSSGLESSSFKDSPMQIDMMGADGASLGG